MNDIFLENSKSLKAIKKVKTYFENSEIFLFIQCVKSEFHKDALKVIGIISAAALVTNAVVSIFMDIEVNSFGWVMRIALMSLSATLIFNSAHWKDIKKASLFVNLLTKGKKRQ